MGIPANRCEKRGNPGQGRGFGDQPSRAAPKHRTQTDAAQKGTSVPGDRPRGQEGRLDCWKSSSPARPGCRSRRSPKRCGTASLPAMPAAASTPSTRSTRPGSPSIATTFPVTAGRTRTPMPGACPLRSPPVRRKSPRGTLRRTETGNDPSAPLDEGGIDLAQLAAELRLDELPPRPALDEEQRRLRIPGSALLNLDGLLNNVAKSIADGFNREGGMLVKVLTGIDDRLTAIERRVCRQQQCRDCGAARGTGRGAGRSCPGARRPLRLLIAVFTVLHAALGFLRSPAWSRSSRRWPPRSIR